MSADALIMQLALSTIPMLYVIFHLEEALTDDGTKKKVYACLAFSLICTAFIIFMY
ncbi:hypothetical protein CE91St46_07900 [Eubacteriales bacterium]|nr:hypothetical protein CE91St46_07900 [Eubacteriales bacterium]GKH62321.1 hypothetical protein CE91St47_07900 [Eubacteriales bacterium]